MKILVVNQPFIPHFCRSQRWAARTRARVMRPPDFLAYLTALLEHEGFDVRLIDFPARGWGKGRFRDVLRAMKPDVVVLESSTPSIYSDIECATVAKREAGSVTIMVGTHATALPEETLQLASGNIDFIARGEYEITVLKLIEALLEKRDVRNVEGISFIDRGEIVHTPDRPLIENLDLLPYPAWHQLNIFDYFDGIKLYPFMDIIGGRGCPYPCTFCLWPQVMHGKRARLRRAESIVEEISFHIKRYPGVKSGEFFFEDDTFTVDRQRTIWFCEAMLGERVEAIWSANARPDIIDLELLKLMKRAGCRLLLVGFESGSKRVLRRIGKNLNPDRMRRFALLCKKAGLKVHGCFMIGFPFEREEDIEETIKFSLDLPIETVQFSAPLPFPGTKLYNEAIEMGWLRRGEWWRWAGEEGEEEGVMEYDSLSVKDLSKKIDGALVSFYSRPSFLMNFLFDTKSLNDLYRKLRGGGNFFLYLIKTYGKGILSYLM